MTTVGLGLTAVTGWYGCDYYTTPVTARNLHDGHALFSPSGFIGHGLGFVGTFLMMIGVFTYSLRKRWTRLRSVGRIKHVLEFHIFLCLLGPVLVVYHTAFKFGGLVGVSFWCMVIVVASGVVGRYLYLQIPRTVAGREITPYDLGRQINILRERLLAEYRVPETVLTRVDAISKDLIESSKASLLLTFPKLVVQNLRHDVRMRSLVHRLLHQSDRVSTDAMGLLLEKAHLQRQMATLTVTQQLFRYWHMFHLPFAVIMFIIMIAHVVTALLFGYGWIFIK